MDVEGGKRRLPFVIWCGAEGKMGHVTILDRALVPLTLRRRSKSFPSAPAYGGPLKLRFRSLSRFRSRSC
jgi:hypothetical protein